jgi:uncharacterized protein YndB with AHSA1/START domain
MWEFRFEVTIDAPVEIVFTLISDLPNYQNWNPFLVAASGTTGVGEVVSGKSVLGRVTTSYRHRIFEYIPNRSLCWRDFGLRARFVCGERSRYTEAVDGKTHFTCHLKISGPLSGLVRLLFGEGLRNGIVAEAKALKQESEKEVH